MRTMNFEDGEFARHYVSDGPSRFVPGYEAMQQMAAQLLAERAPVDGRILVLGAGGGLELRKFAELEKGWRFVGLDPSSEMLAEAQSVLAASGAFDRVEWVQGYIPDAPEGPFDGASCLLTLHFVSDDGSKLEALRAIRSRLRPGARLALVDLCLDKSSLNYDTLRDRYARFALASGADRDDVSETRTRLKEIIHTVSETRERSLLEEAGFSAPELFYAGLSWRGWIASA